MPNTNLSITKQKQLLRQHMSQLLTKITSQEQNSCAKSLLANINLFSKLNNIAIYRSISNELSLEYLAKYYQTKGVKLYQPIAARYLKHMDLVAYQLDNKAIFTDELNINTTQIYWYNMDIIYIPLVAIDKLGYRLGRGGGYYDVLLSSLLKLNHRPIFCGVGYNRQLIDTLPIEKHDIRLDYYLSEAGLIKFPATLV